MLLMCPLICDTRKGLSTWHESNDTLKRKKIDALIPFAPGRAHGLGSMLLQLKYKANNKAIQ